jgi:hypothetical protein
MTEEKPNTEDQTRIIVLLYGMLDNGNPFWVFVAVKPSKYQLFQTTHKEGRVDLHNFGPFGEIIVSGEGKAPPEDITLKVAEMYQTDPAKLNQAIELEQKEYDAKQKSAKKNDTNK